MSEYYDVRSNSWRSYGGDAQQGIIWEDKPTRREQGLKFALKILLGGRCVVCGDSELSRLDIDHILPLADGGTYEPSSLQLLCKECHKDKTRRWMRGEIV
jgi:5-methylcytosine-specific restriction endonuclease McrA